MFYKNDVNTVVFYKGNETYMNLVIDMDNICKHCGNETYIHLVIDMDNICKLYQILLECI